MCLSSESDKSFRNLFHKEVVINDSASLYYKPLIRLQTMRYKNISINIFVKKFEHKVNVGIAVRVRATGK